MGGWSSKQLSLLGKSVSVYKTPKKTLELEFVKRENGMSSVSREIRKWALSRGRPPSKQKKKLQIQVEPVKWEHRPLREL
jgi:hypothetical protein